MKQVFGFILVMFSLALFAQETFPQNGIHDNRTGHYAFINATITKSPGNVIEKGTLVIKDGKVVSVTSGKSTPKGAVIIDVELNGRKDEAILDYS